MMVSDADFAKRPEKLIQKRQRKVSLFLIVLALCFMLAGFYIQKHFVSVLIIRDHSLEPVLLRGDRAVACLTKSCRVPKMNHYHSLYLDGTHTVRQLIAQSGDSLFVKQGQLYINGHFTKVRFPWSGSYNVHIPKVGHSVDLTKLNPIEHEYALNAIKRESPKDKWLSARQIQMGNKILQSGQLKLFQLYGQPLDSLRLNALSWQDLALLSDYLHSKYPGTGFKFIQSVWKNNERFTQWIPKHSLFFVISQSVIQASDSRSVGYLWEKDFSGRVLGILYPVQYNSIWPDLKRCKLL